MDNAQGFILMYRKILDSRVFANPEILKLWTLCLLKANYKDRWIHIDGITDPIKVERGEFVTGRYSLHSEYYPTKKNSNKSPLTVWRWLEKLESWEKLNIKTNNKYSIVRIINYDYYQSPEESEQQNEQQLNNRRTSVEHQLNTDNNDNNDNKDKELYTITSEDPWNGEDSVDYAGFVEAFNEVYNLTGRSKLRITDKKRKQIRGRLRKWTGAEILRAWKNRLEDPWLNGEGSEYLTNWKSAMRNDDKIERYQTKRDNNGKKQKGINIDKLKQQLEQSKG